MDGSTVPGASTRFSFPRFLAGRPDLRARLERIKEISTLVRSSLFQLTRECNLRCVGCWYYAYGMDEGVPDEADLDRIRAAVQASAARGVTHAIIVGGEPVLYPKRLGVFAETLPYLSVATNGYRKLPMAGFENVSVGLAVFAGHRSDDHYRAIAAGGRRFEGLFRRGMANYRNDDRVTVVYAVTEAAMDEIDETVAMLQDNGNKVYFSYYRDYGTEAAPQHAGKAAALTDKLLQVRDRYPEAVLSHPHYIRTLIAGGTPWKMFNYDTCATVNTALPEHAARLANGHPVLPQFQAFAQDMSTQRFCSASGDCGNCRDALAMSSWLLANFRDHTGDAESLLAWIEYAESYWRGFTWSPLHWSKERAAPAPATAPPTAPAEMPLAAIA
jgi:organic radical activating enzyme